MLKKVIKKRVSKKKLTPERMNVSCYFNRKSGLDKYTMSYMTAKHMGEAHTISEWDKILKDLK